MARQAKMSGMLAFARQTGGAIAVMTALVMPVLIGVAAYAIDASLLLYRQERLQIAADIGAWAGAELLRDGRSNADVMAFARAVVATNVDAPAGSEPGISVTIPEPRRVEIEVVLGVERIFSRIFGIGTLEVYAASAAVIEGKFETSTCLYLDDPSANGSLFLLNARLTLKGCDVVVASTSNRAVEIIRASKLITDCLTTAGLVNRPEMVESDCPDIEINQRSAVPPPDPLPATPQPPGTCTGNESVNGALSRFKLGQASCGSVIINNNEPLVRVGAYFVSRGNLDIRPSGRLVLPPGSVLVLMDNAQITMDSRAELVITAPSTGELAGVALVAGPARQALGLITLGRLDIEGLIALPGENLLVTGETMGERCTRVHAGKLTFGNAIGGLTQFNVTCTSIPTGNQIRLVPSDP